MNSLEYYFQACNDPNQQNAGNNYYAIVIIMFHELVTKRKSKLLSCFYNDNGLAINFKNINIDDIDKCGFINQYDFYYILRGLNLYFNDLERFNSSKVDHIFTNYTPIGNVMSYSNMELQKLDKSVGNLFATSEKIPVPPPQPPAENIPAKTDSKLIAQLQKLEEIASQRLVGDNTLNKDIQNLQKTLQTIQSSFNYSMQNLQAGLKLVADIRDGIDYNTLEEPINQLMQLLDFVQDSLKDFPQNDIGSREYAITTLNDFQNFIIQSLGMLGVKMISGVNVAFDVSKHRSRTRGIQPTNTSIVTKILKPGFIYKNRVIAKAEVEITTRSVNKLGFGGNVF